VNGFPSLARKLFTMTYFGKNGHLRFLAADPSIRAAEFMAFRTLFVLIRQALATFRSLLISSASRIKSLEKILIGSGCKEELVEPV
jgi:hypothetical protein